MATYVLGADSVLIGACDPIHVRQATLKCWNHAVPKWIGWAMSVITLITLEVS